VLTVLTCQLGGASKEVWTRIVAIALNHRGGMTLCDYKSDGEDGQEVEVEKRSPHRVDLSSRSVGGAD
jgi:hypothetical protein